MADAPLAEAKLHAVGWSFRKRAQPDLAPAPPGALLTLVRDVGNVHDANAVKVLHGAHDIGFLERAVALNAARLLFGSQLRLEARCVGLDGRGHELRLRVYPRDAATRVSDELATELRLFALAPTEPRLPVNHALRGAPTEPRLPVNHALRGAPDADGWLRMPRGVDALEWCRANKPSTFVAAQTAADVAAGGVVWLYASSPSSREADLPRCGKWMLYVPFEHQDDKWSRIVEALCAGELGTGAKTAPKYGDYKSAILIVYTRDWEDQADVLRVALALRRAAGVGQQLNYKTDAHTNAGEYASGGSNVTLYKLRKGADTLTVDHAVLEEARHLVAQPRGFGDGGVGSAPPPTAQAFTGQGRTLGGGSAAPAPAPAARKRAAAAEVEVISLLTDSDDEIVEVVAAATPPRKAAKTTPTSTAAQAAARAMQPWARPAQDDAAAASALSATADAGVHGLALLAAWAGVPPLAAARWLLQGATAAARVDTARTCAAELRMREVHARLAAAGAADQPAVRRLPSSPLPAAASPIKPLRDASAAPRPAAAAAGPNAVLAELAAARLARQRVAG